MTLLLLALVATVIVLWTSYMDGWRDASLGRVDKTTWHRIKWAALYPSLLWILGRDILPPVWNTLGAWWAVAYGLITAGVAYWLWQRGKVRGGAAWESGLRFWFRTGIPPWRRHEYPHLEKERVS